MLKGKDFIVFSDDWGRHPFSCQHIMEHFLPHNRLLWVHTIGLRPPRLNWHDARRAAEKIASWLKPSRKSPTRAGGPHIISPVMIPYNNVPFIRAANRVSVVRAVRRAMAELDMRNPIMLATLPNAADYAGKFSESLLVYYCVDDFGLWPGVCRETAWEMEKSLVGRANLVAATSLSLCESRRTSSGPGRLLSHGVDMVHFQKIGPKPKELEDIGRPVLGFYGLLDERLDLRLLDEVLRERPHWTVLCIGAAKVSLERLEARPNFRRLPHVPYVDLPRYAACFDVALVPYVRNNQTLTINPLKVREYLAAGKPVAATPLPELRRLSPPVHLGSGTSGFIRAVEKALADKTRPEKRREILRGETWADKAELLSGWIEESLGRATL